jgi:hypothetical protein
MPRIKEIEIVVLMNEEGDWDVGATREEAFERLEDAYSSDGGEARRAIHIILKVTVPESVVLRGEVPAEANKAELKVVA